MRREPRSRGYGEVAGVAPDIRRRCCGPWAVGVEGRDHLLAFPDLRARGSGSRKQHPRLARPARLAGAALAAVPPAGGAGREGVRVPGRSVLGVLDDFGATAGRSPSSSTAAHTPAPAVSRAATATPTTRALRRLSRSGPAPARGRGDGGGGPSGGWGGWGIALTSSPGPRTGGLPARSIRPSSRKGAIRSGIPLYERQSSGNPCMTPRQGSPTVAPP